MKVQSLAPFQAQVDSLEGSEPPKASRAALGVVPPVDEVAEVTEQPRPPLDSETVMRLMEFLKNKKRKVKQDKRRQQIIGKYKLAGEKSHQKAKRGVQLNEKA